MRDIGRWFTCAIAAVLLLGGRDAQGASHPQKWSSTYGTQVPVDICVSNFTSQFPGSTQAEIQQIVWDAMDDWNRAADTNFRMTRGIVQTDWTACNGSTESPVGRITVTAVHDFGDCSTLGQTAPFFVNNTLDQLEAIRTTIGAHFGTGCNPDSNAVLTNIGAGGKHDVRSTITHELGHAMGMSHSGVVSAIMYYSLPVNYMIRRPMADDIEGLRDDPSHGYGAESSPAFHLMQTTNNGSSWADVAGCLVCSSASPFEPALSYQPTIPSGSYHGRFIWSGGAVGAYPDTLFGYNTDFGSQTDGLFCFTGDTFCGQQTPEASTLLGVGLASSYDGYDAIAYGGKDWYNNGCNSINIVWRYYNGAWTKYLAWDQNGTLIQTRSQPALAYLKHSTGVGGTWVLLTTEVYGGRIVVYTSQSVQSGFTYQGLLAVSTDPGGYGRTSEKMGLTCRDTTQTCDLNWIDGNDWGDSTHTLRFNVYDNGTFSTAGWSPGRASINGGSMGVGFAENASSAVWAWSTHYSSTFPFASATGPSLFSITSSNQTSVHTSSPPAILSVGTAYYVSFSSAPNL